ncbi:hypothetical protein CEUSTIGMA_g4441.t1 [Chlamydomonas eustigma]|uniref:DUF4476 domain-containing protein n=1 Tax=Chlamydomonas eustigma TaxID=1157962 RepID=A0A250X1M0_9CHLO|nr:hypothetical protein CEUSTIGMA_g4441.t1 [Chlamydomonas eustigma]|eukprot:GAX76994.1 hypothetical protein CEUSTIGMA_g4441.t1 [Chlamydomonas eustigma]
MEHLPEEFQSASFNAPSYASSTMQQEPDNRMGDLIMPEASTSMIAHPPHMPKLKVRQGHRHGPSNKSLPNLEGFVKLPRIHQSLSYSLTMGDSSSSAHRTQHQVLQEKKEQAESSTTARAKRNAKRMPASGPILKWKDGTAEIEQYKQEPVGAAAQTAGVSFAGGSMTRSAALTMRMSMAGVNASMAVGSPTARGARSISPSRAAVKSPETIHAAAAGSPATELAAGASSSSAAADNGYGLLTDQGLPPPEDEITARLLSLPDIVCKAASGDIFIVGLGDVRNLLHKRRLGPKGLKVWKKFELETSGIPFQPGQDAAMLLEDANEGGDARSNTAGSEAGGVIGSPILSVLKMSKSNRRGSLKARPKLKVRLDARDGEEGSEEEDIVMHGGGISPSRARAQAQMDEDVRNHLEVTMAMVEKHRKHILVTSGRYIAQQQKIADAAKLQRQREKAMDFVIHQMLPDKFLHMARICKPTTASKNEDVLEGDDDAGLEGGDGNSSPKSRGGKAAWNMVQNRVTKVVDRMPFLKEWAKVERASRMEATGWDSVVGTNNDLYVKNNTRSQGTSVYVLRCQEIGIVPSSQVVQQLQCARANMGYCQLGRTGAKALRNALAINTMITELDLNNNGLDAVAIKDIVTGLASGNMVHVTPKGRRELANKWISLGHGPKKSVDLQVSMVPASILSSQSKQQEDAGPSRPSSKSGEDVLKHLKNAGVNTLLKDNGAISNISVVDFSDNPLGVNGAKVVASLLDPVSAPHQFLTSIKLSKCGIPEAGGIAIAKAIANSNQVLKRLVLSNNMLGNKAAEAFGEMLPGNRFLTELDLSWNMIKAEGVGQLCLGLEENIALKKLNISWNGLETAGVKLIGKMISANRGLLHLDLTNTRMGSEAAIMIAEGIINNNVLEELVLNGNTVGDDGARHLMNALKVNSSLQYLGMQGTNMSSGSRQHAAAADFNPLAPDGRYSLNLAEGTDRAIATQLCSLDAASEADYMKNIKLEGRNIPSCKSANWPGALPVRGILSFDFSSKKVRKIIQVMEQKKFQALIGQLASNSMSDKEKLNLVEVMAPFNFLYCHQIAIALSTFTPLADELVQAASILFTRAADLEDNMDLIMKAMEERDMVTLQGVLGWNSYIRFSNPTGHYELSLSTSSHKHYATRLKDQAYTEALEIPAPLGAPGMVPNSNWINLAHDLYTSTVKVYSSYGPPEAWKTLVPNTGVLSFDYVSATVPPNDAVPISDDQLLEFLHRGLGIGFDSATGALVPEADNTKGDVQIALLRQELGLHFYVTCEQVVRIMDCFLAQPQRVEVLVILYSSIIDRENIRSILGAMRPLEQSVCMWRLGPLNLFDKSHLSGHYVLDTQNPAHEQAAHRLVNMANQNPEIPNFWNIRMQGARKNITENQNMWGMLTAETFTPFLEFDYISTDVAKQLGKTQEEFEALNKAEKLELVTRQARRLEKERMRSMYGYYNDGSGWPAKPQWQSYGLLFRAQAKKTPWMAAWDRVSRLLYRYEQRSGGISSDSPVEDIFDEYSNEENEMYLPSFEACLREWGSTKSEIHFFFRELFHSVSRTSRTSIVNNATGHNMSESGTLADSEPAPPIMVIDFQGFVDIFFRDPDPSIRYKEIPPAAPSSSNAVIRSKAKKNRGANVA